MNKKIALLLINITVVFLISFMLNRGSSPVALGEGLQLYYFGESTCGECHQVKTRTLFPLLEKHSPHLEIVFVDLLEIEGYTLLLELEKSRGITEGASQSLFFPDTALLGFSEITASAEALIDEYISTPERWQPIVFEGSPVESAIQRIESEYSEKFSEDNFWRNLWTISILGLLDGVNPCALAAMIFLISFLATRKKPGREVLIIGQSYIVATYITYFLIGVGAFGILSGMSGNHTASMTISILAIQLCFYVAFYSFRDAYIFKKTGKTTELKLQMSGSTKKKIHSVITKNIGKKGLIGGAFIAGFVVTLLESSCTMYSYLPMLRHLSQHSQEFGLSATLWLLWYCFLFIIPLQIVMIASYRGMTWDALAKKTQNHLVLLRSTIGVVMIGLAIYLALHI